MLILTSHKDISVLLIFYLVLFHIVTVGLLLISKENYQFPSMRSFPNVIHSNEAFV